MPVPGRFVSERPLKISVAPNGKVLLLCRTSVERIFIRTSIYGLFQVVVFSFSIPGRGEIKGVFDGGVG